MAPSGRINLETLNKEIERLSFMWGEGEISQSGSILREVLGEEKILKLDLFDQMQIEKMIEVCQK